MNENENGTFGEYTGNADVPDTAVSHPVLKGLYERIADLEKQLSVALTSEQYHASRYSDLQSGYRDSEGKLQDILIEALSNEEIEQDVADSIAGLYDLDLRKVFALNITVTLSVEVSAPIGTELSDIADNIGIGYGGITYSGEGELESDSWEIEGWEEV
jgi:hypothetical protein